MNLIDIYVTEVGRRLPQKGRADIEAELRSTLEDMLEERSKKTGRSVDEALTLDLLKEYGAPDKVATTYQGERYLIGPQLYPVFLMVLKFVFPVIAVLAAFGAFVQVSRHVASVQDVFGTLFSVFAGVVTATISALGSLVLIFAVIERALYSSGKKIDLKDTLKEKEWDPHSLTRINSPDQIKLAERVIEIVGCFAAILIFNFYPQLIGFGFTSGGGWYLGTGSWNHLPLLSAEFFKYVPYLTVVWVLTIVLDVVLLRIGHWNILTRIFAIGLKLVTVIITAAMLVGPSIIALTPASLTTVTGDAHSAQTLMSIITQVVRIALWLGIIGGSIDLLRMIYQTVFRGSRLPVSA
jgi:hypothetical protein